MVSQEIVIMNPSGLHARPAGVLSKLASGYKCDVFIECNEKRFSAKGVLGIMAAAIKKENMIQIVCDGVDEDEALAVIIDGIKNGLGEKI